MEHLLLSVGLIDWKYCRMDIFDFFADSQSRILYTMAGRYLYNNIEKSAKLLTMLFKTSWKNCY